MDAVNKVRIMNGLKAQGYSGKDALDIQLPGGITVQGGAPVLKNTSVLNGYDPSMPRGYGR